MKSNYRALSELIEKVDERNDDGAITELIGVSIDKCFIKSVANTNGTDLSKYKIIRKNEFAVSLMQVSRDSKIPVARLEDYEVAIMSPAYPIFRVKDTRKILPEYLDMWFKRPEFDREAAFIAVGGVRGSMPWEEFVKMKLPVPTIEKQLEIVNSYKAITERIALKQKINDNLAMTLSTLFLELYSQLSNENNRQFDEICTLASSKRVFANDYAACGVPFYRGKEITLKQSGQPITEPLFIETSHFEDIKNKYGVPMKGDILITAVGTIGNSYLVQNEEFYFKDGNIIWLKNFSHGLNYYVYDFMQTSIFKQLLEGICIGSTQTALTIVALSKLLIKIPDTYTLETYVNRSCTIHNQIEYNNKELLYLHSLNNILLSKLSR